jgi:hypothetical protein
MKKAIFSAIGALVVGAIIENKLAVVDKAVKAGKDLIDKVKNQIKKEDEPEPETPANGAAEEKTE